MMHGLRGEGREITRESSITGRMELDMQAKSLKL